MIDLESEMNNAGDAGEAFASLVGAGADPAAITGAPIYGSIGMSRIVTHGPLFEPVDVGGRAAVLVGVHDDDTGKIIDVVAFDPVAPAKFWRRTGAAVFLGWLSVEWAAHYQEPLTMYATPLAWLQAGAHGACWLDTERSLSFWLAGIPAIQAATPTLGAAIDKRLRQEWATRTPRVLVPQRVAA